MFNDHHITSTMMHKLPALPHLYSLYSGAGRRLILPDPEVEGLIQVCLLHLAYHVFSFLFVLYTCLLSCCISLIAMYIL